MLLSALGICTPASLLSQDLAAIPWRDTASVLIYHSTEFADACSVDVSSYYRFNPFLETVPISRQLTV